MESMDMFKEVLSDFNHSDLVSLQVEMPGLKLSLTRGSAAPQPTGTASVDPANVSAPAADTKAVASAGAAAVSAQNSGEVKAPAKTENEEHYEPIQCPLVGVFYSAASPDAEPFVKEGQKVKEGDVLCIIEAMKAMNELKAPYDLIVRKVCMENGDMAEFHQVLFEVEKC